MELRCKLTNAVMSFEFRNLIPNDQVVEVKIEIPEKGDAKYPKTHRPAQSIAFSTTREELREVVRNLDRMI